MPEFPALFLAGNFLTLCINDMIAILELLNIVKKIVLFLKYNNFRHF